MCVCTPVRCAREHNLCTRGRFILYTQLYGNSCNFLMQFTCALKCTAYIHVGVCVYRYFFYIFLLKSYRTFDSNICHTTSAASKVHKIFKRKHYCKLVSVCECVRVCAGGSVCLTCDIKIYEIQLHSKAPFNLHSPFTRQTHMHMHVRSC